MEQTTRESLKIILNLFKNDNLNEEEACTLLESIIEKERTSYYPITLPFEPQPRKNPFDTQPWYVGKPYCNGFYTTTTTNNITEEKE